MDLEILEIAANIDNHKHIDNHTHASKQKNSICGDEMEITLKIKKNKIDDFGYICKSCIYCQASASLLSRKAKHAKLSNINELIKLVENSFKAREEKFPKQWAIFQKLFNKSNISRKECLMLPFKTLSNITKKLKNNGKK